MDRSATLRRARDLLAPRRERLPAAARAVDLLERDLLPRSAGGDAYLVVGIVGPNNAGKSALFNALVGRSLSPSLPTGGATRRLVGAAHPALLARLRDEPTLARFRLQPFPNDVADAPLQPTADPAALLLATEAALPQGLLLIDTPDFDSVLEDNRIASESLLAVADLVVAVVTRHSYQNLAVVRFLERWLRHGRPWMLVYNEAGDAAVAAAHAAKLAADVGTPPLAAFWAPHSLAVQRGEAPLDPAPLAGPEPGRPLQALLFDVAAIAEVKTRALDAALARLRDAVGETAAALDDDARRAGAVLQAAEARAIEAGMRVAAAAMPARPFVDAFRTVLDRRSNPLSRSWRTTLRHIRLGLESLPRRLRGDRPHPEQAAGTLVAIERDELAAAWPLYWEELVRDLGAEARHPARQTATPAVRARLDADLAEGRRSAAFDEGVGALAMRDAEVAEFQRACEHLVERAIEDRGFELDIQAAADLATLVPIALAAAVIVNTGGLGSDLAAVGGGAVGTFLFEKYAHVLGRGIMADARRRWTEVRGRQLAHSLVDAALTTTAPYVRAGIADDTALAARLRELAI
ncbi:50S ribosome-binding GTPase [bacterium]|nr:50S ribosome-binding GTPase [bacterium]